MTKCRLRVPVDAELDLAALDLGDGLGDVGGDGAGLRVRHEAARAEHAAEPADLAHQVGGRDDGVEVEAALGDLVDQLVAADDVGAGGAGLLGAVAGREDQDAGGLAGAVREVDGAADHLVGLAGVDAQAQGDLDGGVELRRAEVSLASRTASSGRVEAVVVDLARPRRGRPCCASVLLLRGASVRSRGRAGRAGPPTRAAGTATQRTGRAVAVGRLSRRVMPIERAVPAMICSAASRSLALRSGILVSAISRTWARVILATLSFCGLAEPLSTPAALRISRAAGGVLVTKVNERSS